MPAATYVGARGASRLAADGQLEHSTCRSPSQIGRTLTRALSLAFISSSLALAWLGAGYGGATGGLWDMFGSQPEICDLPERGGSAYGENNLGLSALILLALPALIRVVRLFRPVAWG